MAFDGLRLPESGEAAFKVLGSRTQGIRVTHSDLSKAKVPVVAGEGASEGAVQIDGLLPSGGK